MFLEIVNYMKPIKLSIICCLSQTLHFYSMKFQLIKYFWYYLLENITKRYD